MISRALAEIAANQLSEFFLILWECSLTVAIWVCHFCLRREFMFQPCHYIVLLAFLFTICSDSSYCQILQHIVE